MGDQPTGTVTFLFTDIVGSTRLWHEHPEQMRAALGRHDEIVRGAIADNGGYIFSTGGDGFAAAFARAAGAVKAARRAQRELDIEEWPGEVEIEVRIGLHTGEVEERDRDYFGPAVNQAARLMAEASGGQVLMSGVTAGVVGPEFELMPLGERQLADVPEPVQLYATADPSMDAELGPDPPHSSSMIGAGSPAPAPVSGIVYAWNGFEVDVPAREIRRGGKVVPVEPQVFDVIRLLIEHRDRVVTKEELLDEVWGDRFVSESALSTRIKTARRTVGDDGRSQKVIRTAHGTGFRFVADVRVARPADAGPVVPGARLAPLPSPTRELIGREDLLDRVDQLLDATRLVTVVGPGGVGKTRFAVELVARRRDTGEGAIFVALSPLRDHTLVASALTEAAGLRVGAGGDHVSAVKEALRGRPTLALLDNFEHVSDAAPFVSSLVEAVPDLRVLVTSRERLRLSAEQMFELPPLDTVGPAGAAGRSTGAAVELFEQAARANVHDFEITQGNEADVVEICRLVDGLPLGVELAAAQLRLMPVEFLRQHLEANLVGVADEVRDRPDRHWSIRDAVGWSYELLSVPQQRLLARMSAFPGGWSLDGARHVAESDDVDLMEGFSVLVDKSLIRSADADRYGPRWSMLHVIREYATDRLPETGEADDVIRRQAEHMVAMVEASEPRWVQVPASRSGPRLRTETRWVDDLAVERRNLGAALEWSFAGDDPELGCRIVAGLSLWWFRTGFNPEGHPWAARALDHVDELDPPVAARVHLTAGMLAWGIGDLARSRRHMEAVLELVHSGADQPVASLARAVQAGSLIERSEDADRALSLAADAVAGARSTGEGLLIGIVLNYQGEVARIHGDLALSERAYREALELNQEMGEEHGVAINIGNIGHVKVAQGEGEASIPYLRAGVRGHWLQGNRIATAWAIAGIAQSYGLLGQPDKAAALIGAADETMRVMSVVLPPADQIPHDLLVGSLVEQLGPQRYRELVEAGRAMTLEDAVALSLED